MKKRIPYGSANYEELVRDNSYFVDKTAYIEKLERIENPVFLRPRKFGKSLWCRILECYYNIRQKDDFERLFGHTYIGQNPTPYRNSYFVLPFNFSAIDPSGTIQDIEYGFNCHCYGQIDTLIGQNEAWFGDKVQLEVDGKASLNLQRVVNAIKKYQLPPLYVIIDEYDNFANQLIINHKDQLYRELTADSGFLKTFFKVLKMGRENGAIANVFITGVLPITIDDMASGFNVANFITLQPEFEAMLGFTQQEVDTLLDEIYRDYELDPATRSEVNTIIKNQYNGYHFVNTAGDALYNSSILMYFLQDFCKYGTIPEYLVDQNLKTDLAWVRRITSSTPLGENGTQEFINQLLNTNSIDYSENEMVDKFNMTTFFQRDFFPISFFYLGMLTRQDRLVMRLPNMNMRYIFAGYFNQLYRIDTSTKYTEMMQGFIDKPDLPKLFADYWRLYVSQLPEAIFAQVNENFYRTTFYALCSQFLSSWFTWNLERSYPRGRSDLEFVGKFHECFAGLRYVIEFKYYSNSELRKLKKTIKNFTLQEVDTIQIAGYVEGLREEYPSARISQFVIYCFGNKGFKVFAV